MSKAVLISINPKWCELIASGKKTIEVRKTRPKLKTPFKCYIYCTYSKNGNAYCKGNEILNGKVIGEFVCDFIANYEAELWDGETFERIQEFYEPDDFSEHGEYEYKTIADCSDDFWEDNMLCKASRLTIEELRKYLGGGFTQFYGWHISDLVIYDKPQELNWFVVEGDCDCMNCKKCSWFNKGNGYNVEDDCDLGYENIHRKKTLKPLFRPPQSWCYIEDLEGAD